MSDIHSEHVEFLVEIARLDALVERVTEERDEYKKLARESHDTLVRLQSRCGVLAKDYLDKYRQITTDNEITHDEVNPS